jgi:hypothetical protein
MPATQHHEETFTRDVLHRVCRNTEGGAPLVIVACYLFLSIGMVLAILGLANNHRRLAARQVTLDQAMYVAEGGLERGARYIESNMVALVTQAGTITTGSGTIKSNGTYAYTITRINNNLFSLISTGTVSSVSRVVSILRIYQPTYAEFALWSHQNGAINFINGEEFWGHVHADDKLYFDASGTGPIFHDIVTSRSGTYSIKNGSLSDLQFDKGYNWNSYQGQMADVDFNSAAATSLKSIATANGLVLAGNSTISFQGSTVKITNPTAGWTNHVYTPPSEGIIYVRNNGSVTGSKAGTAVLNGGTISGRLSVIAENDMTIQNHISYSDDPRSNPNSICALALISQDDISVGTSAPNDLEVDAAVMCTGTSGDGSAGSWGVINYSSGSPRGNLTVYGGIVQNVRGAVGQFSGSSLTHGYRKNYSYDARFINTPPPYYPVVLGLVRFSNWQEGPRQ